MKRKLTAVTAALLAATMLASCSAYSNPSKYITLPSLSEITVSKADIEKEKKEQIDSLMEQNRVPDYKEVKEAAKKGDQLTITYEGKPTDKTLTLKEDTINGMKTGKDKDGKDVTFDLVLGSDSFIGEYKDKDGKVVNKGFEDQLIGKKAGETVQVKVTFPDKYQTTELQGVEVEFTVKIHTVSRLTVADNTLIEVGYEFEEIKAETEEKDETTGDETTGDTNDETAGGTGNESAGTTTTTDSSTNKKPSLDDSELNSTKFTDLFKSGKFNIDFAKTADESKFNTIFKVADYRDQFKGKGLYEEITVEYTVPDDVDAKFKDFKGTKLTIKFTINSATILPEWNDELVKKISNETYTTVAAYEEVLVKEITIDLALTAVEATVKYNGYPKSEAKKLYEEYVKQMVEQTIGKRLDEVSSSDLKKLITDAEYEKIYASAATQAVAAVKSRLLIEYLCEELDVKLSKKEYKAELEKSFKNYQTDTSMMYYYYQYYGVMFTTAEDMEAYFGKESMELQFRTTKMSEELVKVIKVVD